MKIGQHETHPAADVFPLIEGAEFDALVEDIRSHGLREPIVRTWVVDPIYAGEQRKPLILDGRNRLRACEVAKVRPEFRDYEGDDPMSFVMSLNLARRHLNESQRAMIAARALPIFEAQAKERQREGGRGKGMANVPEPQRGTSRDHAASQTNVGARTVQHAATVLAKATPEVVAAVDRGKLAVSAAAELSKLSPDRQREVLARSDTRKDGEIRGGLVRAYAKQAEKAEVARQIEAEPPPMPSGPFRVIVSDPPWAYDKRAGDASHRGDLPYPSMTTDAICALDVESMAHPDGCVLWLWTTNAFMRDAYRVLDAWGFHEKTILTWAKDRMGLGDWLRGQTEHCILAVRGKPTITLSNQTTLLHAPLREHSRKPDQFYELVEALCPGSKVEMFCRTPREGWAKWGAETEKFDAA